MATSVLDLAREAAVDLSLPRPSTLVSDSLDGNETPPQLLRALNKTAAYLAATYNWQSLREEVTFETIAGYIQTNKIPTDFLRFIDETFWDRSLSWPLLGPITPAEWQKMQVWPVSVVPCFTQRGNDILISPAPSAGRLIAFEYIRNTIGSTGLRPAAGTTVGTPIARFSFDTDTSVFDDELMILGAVAFHKQRDGLEGASQMKDFTGLAASRSGHDGGRRRISMRKGMANDVNGRLADLRSLAVVIRS